MHRSKGHNDERQSNKHRRDAEENDPNPVTHWLTVAIRVRPIHTLTDPSTS
jgi:hypothetical protein